MKNSKNIIAISAASALAALTLSNVDASASTVDNVVADNSAITATVVSSNADTDVISADDQVATPRADSDSQGQVTTKPQWIDPNARIKPEYASEFGTTAKDISNAQHMINDVLLPQYSTYYQDARTEYGENSDQAKAVRSIMGSFSAMVLYQDVMANPEVLRAFNQVGAAQEQSEYDRAIVPFVKSVNDTLIAMQDGTAIPSVLVDGSKPGNGNNSGSGNSINASLSKLLDQLGLDSSQFDLVSQSTITDTDEINANMPQWAKDIIAKGGKIGYLEVEIEGTNPQSEYLYYKITDSSNGSGSNNNNNNNNNNGLGDLNDLLPNPDDSDGSIDPLGFLKNIPLIGSFLYQGATYLVNLPIISNILDRITG